MSITAPEGWETAGELAKSAGVDPTVVDRALRLTGMLWASDAHARGEGAERIYSPQAQALVLREVRSRKDWRP
jgi:hypothetical protein